MFRNKDKEENVNNLTTRETFDQFFEDPTPSGQAEIDHEIFTEMQAVTSNRTLTNPNYENNLYEDKIEQYSKHADITQNETYKNEIVDEHKLIGDGSHIYQWELTNGVKIALSIDHKNNLNITGWDSQESGKGDKRQIVALKKDGQETLDEVLQKWFQEEKQKMTKQETEETT